MTHHEKIKLIEWLYTLVEKHEYPEEGIDGDDYLPPFGFFGGPMKLPVELLQLIRQWSL